MKLLILIGKVLNIRRSREGAWIEILKNRISRTKHFVAPARERGLKLEAVGVYVNPKQCRSREGAWIEIGEARNTSNF